MKPSHYADKMLIMELGKPRKTEQKPPNHPAKPGQRSRSGSAGAVLRGAHLRPAGARSGSVSASVLTVASSEKMNTTRWIRCAQTNYKLSFPSFFLSSSLSRFGAGASKPGVFNENVLRHGERRLRASPRRSQAAAYGRRA